MYNFVRTPSRTAGEYVLWTVEEMRLGTLLVDHLRPADDEKPAVTQTGTDT